jgi:hypothetical protein
MTKGRFVTAHGRRIRVETLDTGVAAKPKRKKAANPGLENGKQKPSGGQRFAMLTEERLKRLAGLSPAAWSIYCHLLMVNWRKLRQPVKLTNAVLAKLGVSRQSKRTALPQLERVGLVKVERAGRQAPIVTPLT